MSTMSTLDVPEDQLLVHLPNYAPSFHHRILMRRVSGSVWIVCDPRGRVGLRDFGDNEVVLLQRKAKFPSAIPDAEIHTFDSAEKGGSLLF